MRTAHVAQNVTEKRAVACGVRLQYGDRPPCYEHLGPVPESSVAAMVILMAVPTARAFVCFVWGVGLKTWPNLEDGKWGMV